MAIFEIIFFLACERAEFSKSCNLIGSGSGRKFSILPAHGAIPPGKLAVWQNWAPLQ